MEYSDLNKNFRIEGTVASVAPLGMGHINDSLLVRTAEADRPDYLLQRINHHIFKDVAMLQRNILHVTDHIRRKLAAKGEDDLDRRTLTIIPTREGELFHFDGANYWRVYLFISGARSYDAINPALARAAGKAFGEFQSLLADIPETIGETIPNFHNMEFRLMQFREAVANDAAGRVAENKAIVDAIERRAEEMCRVERMGREGAIPKRINHCDTKVNNILFDERDRALCIVDLDTVMPGYVVSDFGDFVRTGANRGAEDDPDHAGLDMDVYNAYAEGYLETARAFLTPVEIELLPFGARLLTYMQTVRFFADYLNGDVYYKTHHPAHNLQRTKAQLRLLEDMEEKL
ncbi:MAG: aminoglycoside phosphotransferase family protein [Rikenellaceae bacterium]|jgi:Ser/Thr protein kinase RdoA (MazF antagonist)|nr:aminoglycoside phosphotransferase family protein [Rikenellaceae bacterium]